MCIACNTFLLAKTDKKKYNKKVNFTKFSNYYITKLKPTPKPGGTLITHAKVLTKTTPSS